MSWLSGIIYRNGTRVTPSRWSVNFIEGSGVLLGIVDNPNTKRTDVTITASGVSSNSKASVRAVSTSNLASLSGLGTTVDGVLLNGDGNRVLLTAQSTASQNGIWEVHSGAWTRPSDFAAGQSAASANCFVDEGTSHESELWLCTSNPGSAVIDTNNLVWAQFESAAPVDSVFSRTGAVVAAASDYDASQVDNDSSVTGAFVSDALDALLALISALEATGGVLKGTVKAAALANIASLSGLAQTADGINLNSDGDKVLLTAQSTAAENGIWVVHSGAWTRPSNFDTGDDAAGSLVIVQQGSTKAESRWLCTDDSGSAVIDTNNLTFLDISAIPTLAAVLGSSNSAGGLEITNLGGLGATSSLPLKTGGTTRIDIQTGQILVGLAFNMLGNDIQFNSANALGLVSALFNEQASLATTSAGTGRYGVLNTTPSAPGFKDDADAQWYLTKTAVQTPLTSDGDEATFGRTTDDFANAQNENGKSDLVPSVAAEEGDLTASGTAVPLTQTAAGAATAMAVSSEYHFKVKVSIHDGTNFLEPAEYRVYSRRGASGAPSTPIATLVHEGDLGTDSVAFSVDGTNNTIQATPTVASGEKRFKITAEAKRESLMSPET